MGFFSELRRVPPRGLVIECKGVGRKKDGMIVNFGPGMVAAAAAGFGASYTMGGPLANILLVDDRPLSKGALRRLLEERFRSSKLVETDDPDEAIRAAGELRPEIVVLSYLFRKGSVLQLAEDIRRHSAGSQLLFIAMHESWTAVEMVIRSGVRGLVLESDPSDLINLAVEALVDGHAYFSPPIALLCVQAHSKVAHRPNIADLTPRELEVLRHLSRGESNKVMAHKLNISVKTVEAHRAKLLKKVRVQSTVDLVRWALRQKLIQ
jgi:DNA-binding NarL/FixJ family response regulator